MTTTQIKESVPSFIRDINLRLIIFGGKGGTGKTTSAAATAVCLSRITPWKKILVISTDPAHSLADSFDHPIGAKETPITESLTAMELDPPTLLAEFKEKYRRAIRHLAHRAGILEQANVKSFISLSLPGMDEMMAIMQIASKLKESWDHPRDYDVVILDTAPWGHTSRLLALPDKMGSWFKTMDVALDRYRRGTFRAVPFNFPVIEEYHRGDGVDQFVDMLAGDLEMVRALLRDPQTTEFIPVTIPESLGILETEDLVAALKGMGIPVRNMIVNRVRGEQQCDFCMPKVSEQERYIAEIEAKFGSYNLIKMPLFPHEIRGEEGLLQYARHLMGETELNPPSYAVPSMPEQPPLSRANLSDLLEKGLKFMVFGGKGGVGKTSIAAATALRIARDNPDKRVFIYSTDPAHSVADSFDYPVGDVVTKIGGVDNLYALELDAVKIHEDFKREYRANIEDAFDTWWQNAHSWGRQQEIKYDRKVMAAYCDSSPPGLDEVFTLERIMDSVDKEEYDFYILDTAPTGHLLYLLQFPELVREWVRVTYRALLKHQRELPLTNLQTLADKIVKSSISLRKIKEALTNHEQTELVTITIAEAMGVLEMEDLISTVEGLGIPCHHIIMNMIFPPTECDFCRAKRGEELEYVKRVREEMEPRGYQVTELPLFPYEIKGLDRLAELGEMLYGGADEEEATMEVDVVAAEVGATVSPQPTGPKVDQDREKLRQTLTRLRERAEMG